MSILLSTLIKIFKSLNFLDDKKSMKLVDLGAIGAYE